MANTSMKVPSVSCMHCVRRITQALSGLQGVRNVKVDLDAKCVTIEYEGADTVARARAALAEIGYPAED